MGGSETNKTAKEKESKTPSATTPQEPPAATTAAVNPDWTGFQAYSPIPTHGFMGQSPQAHPYMWGVQHMMPPYGTPPHPYVAMYPHGGMYAHPSIPPGSYPFSPFAMPSPNGIHEASGNTPGVVEADTRSSDVKEKLPIKRSKGSLGSLNVITGKNSEHGKVRGTPANGESKSAESGSDDSSEGSDANSQNDSQTKSADGQDSLAVVIASSSPVPGPATNLNIGMDYWGTPALHGKVSSTHMPGGIPGGSRDGVQPQVWLQDERELKRQRRKQSNRESARRSRLRKQAECDELAQRTGALKAENDNLRSEVNRIKSEYEKLLAENASLKERLCEGSGQEDFRAGKNDQSPSNSTQQTE